MPETPRTPIDPAALTVPVKAILDGATLFPLLDGDAWAGAWAFPPSWDAAARDEWTAVNGHLIAETARRDGVLAQGEVYFNSPAFQIAQVRSQVAEARREAEIAERQAIGAREWVRLREAHPVGSVASLPTVEGDVIIMRVMTRAEADAVNDRAAKLVQAAGADEARGLLEALGAQIDGVAKCILHPDLARVKEIGEKRATLRGELFRMRDELMRARADTEGKGSAP